MGIKEVDDGIWLVSSAFARHALRRLYELHGLKRINVVVGENSSGKTALLESIFLAGGGSPEIALRLQVQRGLAQILQLALDRNSYESLWRQLFLGFDQKKTISIDLFGSQVNTKAVTVAYRSTQLFLRLRTHHASPS